MSRRVDDILADLSRELDDAYRYVSVRGFAYKMRIVPIDIAKSNFTHRYISKLRLI